MESLPIVLRRCIAAACAALLCAALPASQNIRVNGPLVPGGDAERFAWTADGSRILYSADQTEDQTYTLYSVLVEAGIGGVKLTPLSLGAGRYFVVSPDGQLVAFYTRGICLPPECYVSSADLLCRPVDGSYGAWNLNQDLPGLPGRFRFSVDSAHVVFTESVFSHWVQEIGLFGHPAWGEGPPTSLTEPPGMIDFQRYLIEAHALSPDGTRVVFKQHQEVDWPALSVVTLFSVPIDRSLPPTVLNEPIFDPVQDVQPTFQVSPDSRRVLFVADQEVPGIRELFSAPIEGSSPSIRLGPPLAAEADVDPAFRITPDGSRALFVADTELDEALELWSVPLDPARGSAAVRLSAKPVPGGGVAPGVPRQTAPDEFQVLYPQFEISPDSARVAYRADARVEGVFELWSAPVDGSAPPVLLNAPLGASQDVALFGFRISADGSVVVYAAHDDQGTLRLHAASIDGTSVPIDLGGPFPSGGGLWLHPDDGALLSFELTPNGSTAVYLADQREDEVFELFAVPVDGSRSARALNGPLAPGGDVHAPAGWPQQGPFALSPDGKWVAYLADQRTDGVVELFLSRVALPRVFRKTSPPLALPER